MILGVLLVLLLTFGCVFAVRRAAHKKGADASESAHKTEQTGSTGAYENVELVTEGEKAKELETQGKTEKEVADLKKEQELLQIQNSEADAERAMQNSENEKEIEKNVKKFKKVVDILKHC